MVKIYLSEEIHFLFCLEHLINYVLMFNNRDVSEINGSGCYMGSGRWPFNPV